MYKKPLLCRVGAHVPYKDLPKVGGDLGKISRACRRCGWGFRTFSGKWDIPPKEVQRGIEHQAEIEFGRVLGFFPAILDPVKQMEAALFSIKSKFSDEELVPIIAKVEKVKSLGEKIKSLGASLRSV